MLCPCRWEVTKLRSPCYEDVYKEDSGNIHNRTAAWRPDLFRVVILWPSAASASMVSAPHIPFPPSTSTRIFWNVDPAVGCDHAQDTLGGQSRECP